MTSIRDLIFASLDQDDALIDALAESYTEEFTRWRIVRRRNGVVKASIGGAKPDTYDIVRTDDHGTDEIWPLTKRQAPAYTFAEGWLNTMRSRAAIREVLTKFEEQRG